MTPVERPEAEMAVIGSIFLDAAMACRDGALLKAKARLRAEDFYSADPRGIFEAILRADADGFPVDVVTMAPRLRATGQWEAEELHGILTAFGDGTVVPSSANVSAYIEQVAEASAWRQLAAHTKGALAKANDPTVSFTEAVAELTSAISESQRHYAGRGGFDLGESVDEAIAALDGDGDSARRWATGIPAIERITGGFRPGQHWVIGARSQHCKTAMACNMTLACLRQGGSVVMFRYEETVAAVLYRLASQLSGVPYSVALGELATQEDRETFRAGLEQLKDKYADALDIEVGLDLPAAEAIIAERRPWLVIYDTLQAAAQQLQGRHEGRHDLNIGAICGNVSRLALAHEHAAVVISQLKKDSVGIPTMVTLRESGAIEEAADIVLLCWWPQVEREVREDDPAKNYYVIKLGKNRVRGMRPTLVCELDPGTQKFGPALPQGAAKEFVGKAL